MPRPLALALGLITLAACGGPHAARPAAGGDGAITITPGQPDADFGRRGFDDHGALPAVSVDGTLVAALFHDHTDFVGVPVDTLVIWRTADGERLGEVASGDGSPPDEASPAVDDGARGAAEATRALAGQRWIHAPAPATVTGEDRESSTVTLVDGTVVRYVDGKLGFDGGAIEPDRFASAGDLAPGDAGADGTSCGGVMTVAALAEDVAGDWLLLAPDRIELGGDACTGKLTAELAILARLRR